MAREKGIAGIATAPAYTWYILNFSKLTSSKLYSDIFVADGYKWRLLVYPKGNGVNHLSLFSDVPDSSTMPDGWCRDVELFSITVVNQFVPEDSIRKYSQHRFDAEASDWGFKEVIPLADLHDLAKGYVVDDTLVVEVRVSISAESSSHLLVKSKNLLAELSSMNNTQRSASSSSEISESNLPQNRQSLQQQRKALQGYLASSLEANELTNAFDEIERIALQLAQHSPKSLEKTVLKDLVSRLPTFKEMLPTTKSTIETMKARRTTISGKSADVGSRLGQGQGQLSSVEAEYYALSEEELGLDAEILLLIAQKQELLIRKNSVALDLKKINEQVSTDLEEWKDISKETEEVDQDWLQAREELARANLSWKLFQQNFFYISILFLGEDVVDVSNFSYIYDFLSVYTTIGHFFTHHCATGPLPL